MGCGPVPRQQFFEQPRLGVVLGRHEAFHQVRQISTGLDAVHATAGQQGVDDRALFSGGGVPDEGPVFRTDLRRAELRFEQVGVEAGVAVAQAFKEGFPAVGGVARGGAELVGRDAHVGGPRVRARLQLRRDGKGVLGAAGLAGRLVDALPVPLFFEGVEPGDFVHGRFGVRGLVGEGGAEGAEDVRPAGQEDEAGACGGEVAVSGGAVAFATGRGSRRAPWRRFHAAGWVSM